MELYAFQKWCCMQSVLKTWKTTETKTWITQNFQIPYPIQCTTMWKFTFWGFRKCGTFWVYDFLKGSYWLSKSSQISKKKLGQRRRNKNKTKNWSEEASKKKDTATILIFRVWHGISGLPIGLVPRWFRGGPEKSKLWPCLFFVTPLIFGDGPEISKSVDFEQQ